jgi:hypothetical protein
MGGAEGMGEWVLMVLCVAPPGYGLHDFVHTHPHACTHACTRGRTGRRGTADLNGESLRRLTLNAIAKHPQGKLQQNSELAGSSVLFGGVPLAILSQCMPTKCFLHALLSHSYSSLRHPDVHVALTRSPLTQRH